MEGSHPNRSAFSAGMRIENDRGQLIRTMDDWRRLAPPASPQHGASTAARMSSRTRGFTVTAPNASATCSMPARGSPRPSSSARSPNARRGLTTSLAARASTTCSPSASRVGGRW